MISRYSPLVLCSSKRQYPGSKMARVLNWRNGWGFKIPLGFRILMDGASSTVGESFVQFWPKLLPLWCKSAVAGASPLLVQAAAAVWCKSGAPTGEQQLWWKQGKFGASSVRLFWPRAHCLARRHTQVKPAPPLSLSLPPALCPETSSHRPPLLSPLPPTFSPSPSQHCPPKYFPMRWPSPHFL